MVRLSDTRFSRVRRRLLARFRDELGEPARTVCAPAIGFASGKGGTGKTLAAANLAVALAAELGPVQLVDADLGLGNAHAALGLKPTLNLGQWLDGEVELTALMLASGHGVRLLPGGSGISRLAQLDHRELRRLATALSTELGEARAVLVDSAAGIAPQTLLFLRSVDLIVLVVTPELTSLTDAYALIKCLVLRGFPGRFLVLVNRSDDAGQAREVFEKLAEVAGRFLSLRLHYLGGVPEDRAVRGALAAKVPLVVRAPQSPAGRALRLAAGALLTEIAAVPGADERPDFAMRLLGHID